ncbi:uncharacterized protein LOC111710964 [Eurytemora carolleeae]|uniref:uncharacterized protein LOC111710964 n=1 Tax=Eurytemora carolleeae TaxID=1294199 RepID=UPI000C7594ED|nr:uncharacterized protein LOC111710964 [Eurytemora carolleeae]|eukprot:XP_023340938.1 uncharacterized protein LOC111710964 [Eurytemora affinis]
MFRFEETVFISIVGSCSALGLGRRISGGGEGHDKTGRYEEKVVTHDPVCIIIISVLSAILFSLALYKIVQLCTRLFRIEENSCSCLQEDIWTLSKPDLGYIKRDQVDIKTLHKHVIGHSKSVDEYSKSVDGYSNLVDGHSNPALSLTLLNLNLTNCSCYKFSPTSYPTSSNLLPSSSFSSHPSSLSLFPSSPSTRPTSLSLFPSFSPSSEPDLPFDLSKAEQLEKVSTLIDEN